MESILEGFAQYYSAELSQKIRRGQRESIEKRKFLGGSVPFGFVSQGGRLAPDPVKADVVRMIFERAADGMTFVDIAALVNAEGFRTTKGKPFSGQMIHRILHSKRYVGYYIYKDVEVPDESARIISDELFEQVQDRIRRERNRKKKGKPMEYLLSGKLFCGHCGEPMYAEAGTGRHGGVYRYYACSGKKAKRNGCTKKNVKKDIIERFVLEKAREQLTPEVLGWLSEYIFVIIDEAQRCADKVPAMLDQLKEIERKIENLVDIIADGRSNAAMLDKLDALEVEKQNLQTSIDKEKARQATRITKDDVSEWLAKVKKAEVRSDKALINAFIERVELFDDEDDNSGNQRIKIYYKLYGGSEGFEYHLRRTTTYALYVLFLEYLTSRNSSSSNI